MKNNMTPQEALDTLLFYAKRNALSPYESNRVAECRVVIQLELERKQNEKRN